MRRCARSTALAIALLFAALGCAPAAPASGCDAGPAQLDDAGVAAAPQIGLYDGNGIWAEGLAAIAASLQAEGLSTRILSAAQLQAGALAELDAVVLGGGWAWDQWQSLGAGGIRALREFVHGGGGYLGICAGAYLASDDVVWESDWIAYPLNLFNGTAEGPVAGLPLWPEYGTVPIRRVDGSAPLQGAGELAVYYQGGGHFVPRDPAEITPLLRYADGSLAALSLPAGAGRVVLSGVHLEMQDYTGDPPTAADNVALLGAAVRWLAGGP